MQVIDSYRGVKLIFNASVKEEKMAYDCITEVQMNHKGFKVEVVLYDESIGIIDSFQLLQ